MESLRNAEQIGHKVRTCLKFIRHGERTKTGELTDYGREVTRSVASPNMVEGDWHDKTFVIGSNVDPNRNGIGRSLETAAIYGLETDGTATTPIPEDRLNYKHMKSLLPYNHTEVYNSFLPSNFETLTDKEKVEAARVAQEGVMKHLLDLHTPEAESYKREAAGAFADLVLECQRKNHELPNGYTQTGIAGTHGGTMEFLLQQALVCKEGGEQKIGFDNFGVIGGIFHPSESYDVVLETDESGKDVAIKVIFDDPKRGVGELTLDINKLKELAVFYKEKQQS